MKIKIKKQHLRKLLLINIAIVAVVIFAFMRAGKREIITVNPMAMNVRSGPGIEFDIAGQVKRGDKLTVIKKENKWYKVKMNDRSSGWVASWIVNESDDSPATNVAAKVNTHNTKLRKKANTESQELDSLTKGTRVTVTSEKNGWSKVTVAKKKGWIYSELLSLVENAEKEVLTDGQLFARQDETKIREEPSIDGTVIATIDYGDSILFKEREGDWYQVETNDGTTGYVASWVVDFEELDQTDKKIATSIAEATIVLDPGHGGSDVGAQSNDGTITEKIITLATANYVKKELEKLGANVILTRSDDSFIGLADIALASNKARADAFISFHYDSTEISNQASGFTTYYYDDKHQDLAEITNKYLALDLPLPNRGVEQGDYQVLRENKRPAILLELGYMNNDSDAHTFKTKKFQRQVARALASALVEYFED